MALSITKNWDDGTVLTESQLDDIKTSLETFVNTTKLDNTNIQTGGISSANLSSGAVTTAKIDSGAVTTAKIADNAVTQAKRAALGQQISSSSGAYSTTSSTYVDATNMSVSITTTGRPVWVGLMSGSTSNAGNVAAVATGSVTQVAADFKFVRDSTDISIQEISVYDPTSSSSLRIEVPTSSLWFIDVPSAGTYTYKLSVKAATASTGVEVNYAKLVAYEL